MTTAELIALIIKLDDFEDSEVLSACDSDPGYAHALLGVRRVGDRIVLDLDFNCETEALSA